MSRTRGCETEEELTSGVVLHLKISKRTYLTYGTCESFGTDAEAFGTNRIIHVLTHKLLYRMYWPQVKGVLTQGDRTYLGLVVTGYVY
jgi:hypothetical protein